MNTIDLHEEFLNALNNKIPRKGDLVNEISDLLKIEKDAAYRRLSGKVMFSAREIGIVSDKLNISLDKLMMRSSNDILWMPFILEHPLKTRSMHSLYEVINQNLGRLEDVLKDSVEAGNIYNSLPMEFFFSSPMMTKFMFFKWGNYFVGTEEFDNFSEWEVPSEIWETKKRMQNFYNFEKIYYIWDEALVWNFCREVITMHKMNVLTTEEMKEIGIEFKEILSKIESTLNGSIVPSFPLPPEMEFYVSSVHLGFTCCYFLSQYKYFVSFQTNFSFSMIDDSPESFSRLKSWMDSFRSISVLLSHSGRVERKLFFDSQYKVVDYMLKIADIPIF